MYSLVEGDPIVSAGGREDSARDVWSLCFAVGGCSGLRMVRQEQKKRNGTTPPTTAIPTKQTQRKASILYFLDEAG